MLVVPGGRSAAGHVEARGAVGVAGRGVHYYYYWLVMKGIWQPEDT